MNLLKCSKEILGYFDLDYKIWYYIVDCSVIEYKGEYKMKKNNNSKKALTLLMSLIMLSILFINISVDDANAANIPRVVYEACIKNEGWCGLRSDAETAGTTGQSKPLEGARFYVEKNAGVSGSIQYRTYSKGFGWLSWTENGELSNNDLKGARVDAQAFQIRLTGELAQKYDVVYRVHSANYGWLDWVRNGQTAGRYEEGLRVEAIQVKMVEKAQYRAVCIGNFVSDAVYDEVYMGQFFKSQGIDAKVFTGCNTKQEAFNNIRNSLKDAKETDVSYVYLAAHGVIGSQGDLALTKTEFVSLKEIRDVLDTIPGTIVLMDVSCFSGYAIDTKLFTNQVVSVFAPSSKYKIITGCKANEVGALIPYISVPTAIWGEGCGYNYFKDFTYDHTILPVNSRCTGKLKADYNKDGYVTLNELYKYTNEQYSKSGITFRAQVYPENDDFVFLKEKPSLNN